MESNSDSESQYCESSDVEYLGDSDVGSLDGSSGESHEGSDVDTSIGSMNSYLASLSIDADEAAEHPAVLSGPSTNPEKQLLGLPIEVRLQIYQAFLVKTDNIELRCEYRPDGIVFSRSLSVNKGVPAFLSTCSQIHTEGTDVLYGDNTFECYHVRVFKHHFIHGVEEYRNKFKGIGTINAAKIKRALFGLPYTIIRNAQDSIQGNSFLGFMCEDLVGLQKLSITSKAPTEQGSFAQRLERYKMRPLISTAATIAKYHPTLRKAIWPRRSGFESVGGVFLAGEFYVDLVAIGFQTWLDGCVTKTNAFGAEYESNDILLNTSLIRSTSWLQDNIWNSVDNFKLDKEMIISRVQDSELATWPGEDVYEPLLELELADRVALVEESHSRFIRGHFVRGRYIDNRFIKGCWPDSDRLNRQFVQGKHVGARMVEGKQVKAQFVEGRWESDNDFIEGKWVDEHLIKGLWADWRGDLSWEGCWKSGLFFRGRWEGGHCVPTGMVIGGNFYEGRVNSVGLFVRGAWAARQDVNWWNAKKD